jgi:hypothetical protein
MVRRSRRTDDVISRSLDPECIIPRALVLCQPAATLVAHGVWPILPLKFGTDYRGKLYLVASVRWDEYNRAVCNAQPYRDALVGLGYGRHNPLPLGSIVGHVKVEACECYSFSETHEYEETDNLFAYRMYYGSRYMRNYYWHFGGARVVGSPIPCEGRMGLFRLEADLAERARAAATGPAGPPLTLDAPDTVIQMGMSLAKRKS